MPTPTTQATSLERFYTPIPLACELTTWLLRPDRPFGRLLHSHAAAGRVSLTILEPFAGLGHLALGAEQAVREHVATLGRFAEIEPTIKLRGWEVDPTVLAAGPPWITGWDAGQGADLRGDPLRPCAPPGGLGRLLPLRLILANPPWSQILARIRQLRQLQTQVSTLPAPAPLAVLCNLQVLESLQRIEGLWLADPPDDIVVLARRVHWTGPDAVYTQTPKMGSALLVWNGPRSPDHLLTATRLHFLRNQGGTNPAIRQRQELALRAASEARAAARAAEVAAEGKSPPTVKAPRKRRVKAPDAP